MARSQTLTVRLSTSARNMLTEVAASHDASGASALAREILERWAAEQEEFRRRAQLQRLKQHLEAYPDWNDDPAEFFPAIRNLT